MTFDTTLPADAQQLNKDEPDNRELVSVWMLMPNLKVKKMMMYTEPQGHSTYGECFEFEDGIMISASLEENGFYYSKQDCIDDSINKLIAQS